MGPWSGPSPAVPDVEPLRPGGDESHLVLRVARPAAAQLLAQPLNLLPHPRVGALLLLRGRLAGLQTTERRCDFNQLNSKTPGLIQRTKVWVSGQNLTGTCRLVIG